MSKTNPSLYEVLGETASSKQPIEEGDIFQALQSILREKHRALRVLLAEKVRASFTEEEAYQLQLIDEYNPTEADKLQIKNDGIQLGCLLVQRTKGETQLQVTRWLQTTNAWEAWRQLNLQCTTSKWSKYFQLLTSITNTSFDTQPASFLQQFNAWKEQVPREHWCSICWKKAKLAGGTATSSINSSTNNNKLGIHQASRGHQQQKLQDRGISLSFAT